MDIIERFFDHDLAIAVTSLEEYESLLGLLIKLKSNITWASGQDLYDFDGFTAYEGKTYIAYNDERQGITRGWHTENTKIDVISYEQFKSFVDGQRRLTFEEVLFGTEDEK